MSQQKKVESQTQDAKRTEYRDEIVARSDAVPRRCDGGGGGPPDC
jgi:hypothetical protein